MEKNVILDVLKKSIHNILQLDGDQKSKIIEDSRITQSLCSSIEAMFLHGGISTQSNNIFSKFRRVKQSYEFDFRDFLVEFIPRNLLQVFEHHEFKLTPVGFSRVWLRYSLNESTILSYLESMIKDDKRLKRFYTKESLIRDEELMGAFCGMLKSIEHLEFKLDTSLPLLNTWVNSDALQIAGLQHHSVSKCDTEQFESIQSVDLTYPETSNFDDKSLSTMLTNEEEILPTNLLSIRIHSSNSVPTSVFLQSSFSASCLDNADNYFHDKSDSDNDSDVGLDENKSSTEELSKQEITNDIKDNVNDIEETINSNEKFLLDEHNPALNNENSESNIFIESFSECLNNISNENAEIIDMKGEIEESNIVETNPIFKQDIENRVPHDSFDNLWTHCNLNTTISIEEVHDANIETSTESSGDVIIDNCTIPDEIEPSKGLKKLMDLYPGVSESSSRSGENSVFGGLCHKCNTSLETNKVFFDYYDGQLYCFGCESKTKAVIPRDVISNWDFTPKSVSKTTKQFLSEIMVHPNINLASNSCLFEVVPELTRVRKLRHKLSLLWLQVTSCDIETSTKVQEAMFPREYMLASIKEKDLYSLEDLIMLHNGVLEKTLLHVIDKIAIPHVTKCLLCRMKALACDHCRDRNNLIYIHDIDFYCECSTPLCQSVIHKNCKKPGIKSFYCRRCVQYLESHQPITLGSYDTADTTD